MSDGGGKRSLRLDYLDCQAHSSTSEGAAPLVDPSAVPKSSRDPHHGLYPRPSRRQKTEPVGSGSASEGPSQIPTFQKASSLLKNSGPPVGSHDDARPMPPDERRLAKSAAATQANKITGYFEATRRTKRPRSPSPYPASPSAEWGAEESQPSCQSKDRLQAVPELLEWHSDSSSDSVMITDVFGLVPPPAAAAGQDEERDPFERLPNELLEHILARVGLQDLLLTCNRVCTRWRDVIQNPLFLANRKRYYRFKSGRCGDTTQEVLALCKKHNMDKMERCIPSLIRYMGGFKESATGLRDVLVRLPQYDIIVEVLQLVSRDHVWPPKVSESARHWWSAVAALVTVAADSVQDLRSLFHRSIDETALSEAFYCLATFLLHFQRTYNLCHAMVVKNEPTVELLCMRHYPAIEEEQPYFLHSRLIRAIEWKCDDNDDDVQWHPF